MIPVNKPSITRVEKRAVMKALNEGKISSQAGIVEEFEIEFAKKLNHKYAVAVNSGSSALFLLLKSLGIKKGDNVAIPDYSFIAVANAVAECGANIVPVDCDLIYNIDPHKLEATLKRNKIKAVVIVHTYGIPCEMKYILELKKRFKFVLVEDCCEALGTKGVGIGHSVYSFFASKTMTTGEGGMICTPNKKISEKCKSLRNYCKSKTDPYKHTGVGYNFRLTSLQAALGLAQLSRLKNLVSKRERLAYIYQNKLRQDNGLTIIPQKGSSYWAFPVFADDPKRLASHLKTMGIDTRGGFYPTHLQFPYKMRLNTPLSVQTYNHTLTLPLYYDLTVKQVEYIAETINKYYEQKGNLKVNDRRGGKGNIYCRNRKPVSNKKKCG